VPDIQELAVPASAQETSGKLDADLHRLRDYSTAIAKLLAELEKHLALPLPPEAPVQVMSDVTVLQDQVYDMARRVGGMKHMILQQTLAAAFSLQEEKGMRTLGWHHRISGQNECAGHAPLGVLALQRKARLENDLIMLNLAVLHVSTSLHHLKPVQVSQGLVRTLDRRLNRILDAACRRAHQFNDFVDVIRHRTLPASVQDRR
jgi:hypothetical protein